MISVLDKVLPQAAASIGALDLDAEWVVVPSGNNRQIFVIDVTGEACTHDFHFDKTGESERIEFSSGLILVSLGSELSEDQWIECASYVFSDTTKPEFTSTGNFVSRVSAAGRKSGLADLDGKEFESQLCFFESLVFLKNRFR